MALLVTTAACVPPAPQPSPGPTGSTSAPPPPVPGHYEPVADLCERADLSALTALMPVADLDSYRNREVMTCEGTVGVSNAFADTNRLVLEVAVYGEYPHHIESAHARFLRDRQFDIDYFDAPVTPVAGVGQAAYRQVDRSTVWIRAWDGDAFFDIRLAPFGDAPVPAATEEAMAATLRATMAALRTRDLQMPESGTPAPGHVPGHYEPVADLCAAADLSPLSAVMPVIKEPRPSLIGGTTMVCTLTIGERDEYDLLNFLSIEVRTSGDSPFGPSAAQIAFVDERGLDSEDAALTPVDGLGQDAYRFDYDDLGFQIVAYDGDALFALILSPFGDQPASAQAEEAAVQTLLATMEKLRSGDLEAAA